MYKHIEDNFFYIDSNNVDNVQPKMYGFCITKDNSNISLCNDGWEEIAGYYINVKKKENGEIYISTDDFSSLYIFYYVSNDFFALSNSFYLLIENLRSLNKDMTVDKDFIIQFLQSPLHSHSLYGTMVKEVKILPFGNDILIKDNKIEFIDKGIQFESVHLFSEKGMSLLNNWINKWINIIKAIHESRLNIEIDLSGGYDSRIPFVLNYATGANLNRDNVKIYSKIGQTKGMIDHLMDDYDIAKQITDKLGIEINKQFSQPNIIKHFSKYEQYALLKYTFLGIHKMGFNCVAEYENPKIHFGGLCGEVIRGSHPDLSSKKETIKKRLSKNPIKNYDIAIDNLYNDIKGLENSGLKKSVALTKLFLSIQCRSHFGLSIFNSFVANIFSINPFSDKDLLRLYVPEEYNKNIIFAIIIYQTCPEIFDIPFTNNSNFDDNVKSKTIELCNIHKFKFIDEHLKLVDLDKLYKHKENNYDKGYGYDVAYDVFKENKELFIEKFGEMFDKEYAEQLYDYADKFYLNKDNFSSSTWVNCIVAIIETFKILEKTQMA